MVMVLETQKEVRVFRNHSSSPKRLLTEASVNDPPGLRRLRFPFFINQIVKEQIPYRQDSTTARTEYSRPPR